MTRSGRAIFGAISRRLAGATAPAAIALAFVVLVVLALLPAPGTAADGIQVEITECGSGSTPGGCSTGSQTVKRDRGEQRIVVPVAPKPRPAPAATASQQPAERHDVDLRTGRHEVRGTDGKKAADEKVEV